MKITSATAGNTTCMVFPARTWFSNWPLHCEVHPLRQLDLLGDGPLGFFHESHHVAIADVQLHVGSQHAVFALDHGGAFDDLHVGHHGQRDLQRGSGKQVCCPADVPMPAAIRLPLGPIGAVAALTSRFFTSSSSSRKARA